MLSRYTVAACREPGLKQQLSQNVVNSFTDLVFEMTSFLGLAVTESALVQFTTGANAN